ncbi:Sister chromatid cohesion protein PDS A [Ananas comosus]|uniref:Sister chromatid cohesion protein PDS A n=1 Tax=Ananas comosus TaxID=4615 RepID=A0A199ULY1_ANACO|nr:Sister chromatid cohesion protein PDS A [Ananas comosus]
MASADKGLEDRLRKIGDRLRSPATSVEELLPLLDRAERLLLKVEQSPSQSMINAIRPAMNALVAEELLRHPNADVRVSVASCASEITRITAPDAPYDDDLMKMVFQRIVEAFEKLDDMSSSLYLKRVSILETVAKVRSCVVMLDLECDDLILHMFRHFLNSIRSNHPENVFSSMETIMTLVIEESEDISAELVSCLLESLKKESKEINPTAFRLAEKVVRNCGVKLNPALIKLVQNTPLSNYSKVVGSLRQENSDATDRTDVNDSGKNASLSPPRENTIADDNKLSERVSSQLDQVGCPQESDTLANESSQSKMTNGTVPIGNGESVVEPTSPQQKPEQSRRGVESKGTVPETTDDSNNVESAVAKPDSLSDLNAKKMGGRSSNLSTQLTETSDGSRTDNEKETPLVPGSREDHGREADSAQVDGPSDKEAESPMPLDTDNKDHLQLPSSANDGTVYSDPPKRDGSSGSDISDKKGGGDLSSDQLTSSSEGPDSKKASEDLSDSEEKPLRHSGKKGSKKVGEILAGSAVYSEPKTRTRRDKVGSTVKDGVTESSRRQPKSNNKQPKETSESEDAAGELSLKKAGSGSLRNRSGSKRNHGRGTEKISTSKQRKDLDESLVNSMIKVWWPADKAFYDGVVHSYNPSSKKHTIVYNDGDVEILRLKEERWELIEGNTEADEGGSEDLPSPDASSEMPPSKKAKTSSSRAPKKAKTQTPSSNEFSSMRTGVIPKRKSRSKAVSEDKEETPKGDERSKDETPRRTRKSKDDSSNHSAKSNDDVSRTRSRAKGIAFNRRKVAG